MSDDLVEFVRACLARDEQVARRATPPPWTVHVASDGIVSLDEVDGHMIAEMQGCDYHPDRREVDGAHIARHDPARVLAEVEAKRTILDRHEPGVSEPSECGRCNDPWPCDDVKALTQPYAGEPGWQEAWRT